jgi:hypothetical protein
MSAYGLHPSFNDLNGYRAWRRTWRKIATDLEQRIASAAPGTDLTEMHVMMEKTHTLLISAQERMRRIQAMHHQMAEQTASFPLQVEAPSIDFHFNKGCLEFPFLPAWTLKAKGKTYYVSHVDFECAGTTRETPEHPSTKGSMRFRHAALHIDRDGTAKIMRRGLCELASAA